MVSVVAVASMPMYDLPEVRKALDSLWTAFARNLKREGVSDVPNRLEHDKPVVALWDDPRLLFSQCCGYDIVNRYTGKLQPIATPSYGADGCEGGEYCSAVIVAENVADDDVLGMRGAVCVINGPESHSGMSALRALVAPVSRNGRFFSKVKVSGSHLASLQMLQHGQADVAAVDCVTYGLLQSYRPAALSGTRMLGWTYPAPAVPYVARTDCDHDTVAKLRTAVFDTFNDPNLVTVR